MRNTATSSPHVPMQELLPEGSSTPITAVWDANPKPSKNRYCNESIVITDSADVTIYFDGQN